MEDERDAKTLAALGTWLQANPHRATADTAVVEMCKHRAVEFNVHRWLSAWGEHAFDCICGKCKDRVWPIPAGK